MIDNGNWPIGIECTDGIHIKLDLFGNDAIRLDAPAARELVAALNEAIGNARG